MCCPRGLRTAGSGPKGRLGGSALRAPPSWGPPPPQGRAPSWLNELRTGLPAAQLPSSREAGLGVPLLGPPQAAGGGAGGGTSQARRGGGDKEDWGGLGPGWDAAWAGVTSGPAALASQRLCVHPGPVCTLHTLAHTGLRVPLQPLPGGGGGSVGGQPARHCACPAASCWPPAGAEPQVPRDPRGTARVPALSPGGSGTGPLGLGSHLLKGHGQALLEGPRDPVQPSGRCLPPRGQFPGTSRAGPGEPVGCASGSQSLPLPALCLGVLKSSVTTEFGDGARLLAGDGVQLPPGPPDPPPACVGWASGGPGCEVGVQQGVWGFWGADARGMGGTGPALRQDPARGTRLLPPEGGGSWSPRSSHRAPALKCTGTRGAPPRRLCQGLVHL